MTSRNMAIMPRGDPVAPPPSPIPTGKGSRSAANLKLSQHLTTKIPKLSLPRHIKSHRSTPPVIDLVSLLHSESDTVDRVLKAATGPGVFLVTRHGISVDEVRSELMNSRNIVKCENWQSFSQKMENLRYELGRIASELAKILYKNSNKQQICEELDRKEPDFSIHINTQDLLVGGSPSFSSKENNQTCRDYGLSLHLPLDQCEFHVHLKQGTLSFGANHQTILVTIGKKLEEWSDGEFKSAFGETLVERSFNTDRSSFSIELKYALSVSNFSECKIGKTISIADQILIMIAIPILYKLLLFIFH